MNVWISGLNIDKANFVLKGHMQNADMEKVCSKSGQTLSALNHVQPS